MGVTGSEQGSAEGLTERRTEAGKARLTPDNVNQNHDSTGERDHLPAAACRHNANPPSSNSRLPSIICRVLQETEPRAADLHDLSAASHSSKGQGQRSTSLEKLHHSVSSPFHLVTSKENKQSASLSAPSTNPSSTASTQSHLSTAVRPETASLTMSGRVPLMQNHEQSNVRVILKKVDNCAANRRAAIARFKAKRAQRNFDKKIRYTSRQKLAHRRPRVKGQFVKAQKEVVELDSPPHSPTDAATPFLH